MNALWLTMRQPSTRPKAFNFDQKTFQRRPTRTQFSQWIEAILCFQTCQSYTNESKADIFKLQTFILNLLPAFKWKVAFIAKIKLDIQSLMWSTILACSIHFTKEIFSFPATDEMYLVPLRFDKKNPRKTNQT